MTTGAAARRHRVWRRAGDLRRAARARQPLRQRAAPPRRAARGAGALLLLDGPEFAYAFFGAIKIGAVPIPTNTLWKAADYRYRHARFRARVLIVSEELLPEIREDSAP